MLVQRTAPCASKEPQANEAEEPPAEIFKDRGAADSAEGTCQDRSRRKRKHDRRADMCDRERARDGEAANDSETGSNEIGRQHRLALAWGKGVDRAEYDAERKDASERREVAARRKRAEVSAD